MILPWDHRLWAQAMKRSKQKAQKIETPTQLWQKNRDFETQTTSKKKKKNRIQWDLLKSTADSKLEPPCTLREVLLGQMYVYCNNSNHLGANQKLPFNLGHWVRGWVHTIWHANCTRSWLVSGNANSREVQSKNSLVYENRCDVDIIWELALPVVGSLDRKPLLLENCLN